MRLRRRLTKSLCSLGVSLRRASALPAPSSTTMTSILSVPLYVSETYLVRARVRVRVRVRVGVRVRVSLAVGVALEAIGHVAYRQVLDLG